PEAFRIVGSDAIASSFLSCSLICSSPVATGEGIVAVPRPPRWERVGEGSPVVRTRDGGGGAPGGPPPQPLPTLGEGFRCRSLPLPALGGPRGPSTGSGRAGFPAHQVT